LIAGNTFGNRLIAVKVSAFRDPVPGCSYGRLSVRLGRAWLSSERPESADLRPLIAHRSVVTIAMKQSHVSIATEPKNR